MALEKEKIEEVLKKLPAELQHEVLEFVESLLEKNSIREAPPSGNGNASVSSFFGSWDSGDPRSADNDRIDRDLADEYGTLPEAES
jgi:Protein of unknown function (DUF2281)